MKPKGIQLSALLMAMLLIGMAFVPAVGAQAAQDVGAATSIDCPCSQGIGIADDSGAKVETTELSGVNRNKAIAQALSDKGVLKLREELIKSGYKPSIEKISTTKAATINESGTITTTLVAMPFSGADGDVTAVITFASNELGSAAVAVVISDGMLTTLGYDSISGEVQIRGIDYCSFCMWAVGGICAFIAHQGCGAGCLYICTKVPNPLWAAICYGTCWLTCDYIVAYDKCGSGAAIICEEVGLC
ncbi:MAG: halocin C8-like domain-containing protein [Euryarchaeota archaeon]|nr:halocin C8-like domain-containing protein [Euryarchaeota archaeon]